MSEHLPLFQNQKLLDYKQVTCHMCKKMMKMKRSKSLSPEPSTSGEPKRIKYEEKRQTNGILHPHLLDFCDDILLNILKYLSPQDLIALSQCCRRFTQVIRDRTLWRNVDFRTVRMPSDAIEKYTKYLQPTTSRLAIRGDLVGPLSHKFFNTLCATCGQLKELIIEDHRINCDEVHITDFPRTIEKLSLEGCEMVCLQPTKSYFFKIDLHMANLTCLILSDCEWFRPHSLLVISKISKLKELRLNSCHGLGECVAYASLATRFGFKTLETLDLRDTPLGDSEVSCFSSTTTLTHLYLECPSALSTIVTRLGPIRRRYRQGLPEPEPDLELRHLLEAPGPSILPVRFPNNPFLVPGGWGSHELERCLISDRAIRAIGSIDRRVIHNSANGIIFVQEDNRIVNNPLLKTLVVRNYAEVTNLSLVYLAKHISSLEHLDVTGTSVTLEGVQQFKLRRPNVKVVSSFDHMF